MLWAVTKGDLDPAAIGARIRSAREGLGWTRQQLADRVGASANSVANWERGASTPRLVTGAVERELGITIRGDSPDGPTVAEASLDYLLAEVRRRVAEMEQDLAQLRGRPAPRANQTRRRRDATVTPLRDVPALPPDGELPEGWVARERGTDEGGDS